jgi:hypothetical protein
MAAHQLTNDHLNFIKEIELFPKVQRELVDRYEIDPNLASEMAWDLIEVLGAVDGNFEILDKYFLH